jgi:hypothetical protein
MTASKDAIETQKVMEQAAHAAYEAALEISLYKDGISKIPFEVFAFIWELGYVMATRCRPS